MSAGKIVSLIAENYHRQYSSQAVASMAKGQGVKLETVQKVLAASRDIRSFPRVRKIGQKIDFYQGIEPVHHETYPQWAYRWYTWITVPAILVWLVFFNH